MNKECEYCQFSQYVYHASAYGIAGDFHRPARHGLPMQGAIILPVTGGRHSHRVSKFRLDGLASFDEVLVEVGGSYDECHDIHTSYSYSVIEGLNIADMLTADRVVSRMLVYSPAKDHGGEHTFDITGSHFENLKIAGHKIDIKLDTGAFHDLNSYSKFTEAYKNKKADDLLLFSKLGSLQDTERKELEDKYHALHGMSEMIEIWKADKKRERTERYICSAFNHIDIKSHAGKSSELQGYGGIICIPKFGVIRLGEVLINKHFRSLTMFRVDMCSTGYGSASGGTTTGSGGTGYP